MNAQILRLVDDKYYWLLRGLVNSVNYSESEAWKKIQGCTGVEPMTSPITSAVLYQLS